MRTVVRGGTRMCAALAGTVLFGLAGTTVALANCGFWGGDVAKGDKVYHSTCVAFHGEYGHGTVPGAPDFTKRGGVLTKPHNLLMRHIKRLS